MLAPAAINPITGAVESVILEKCLCCNKVHFSNGWRYPCSDAEKEMAQVAFVVRYCPFCKCY